MTIGILNEIVAKSQTAKPDSSPATTLDDGFAKYGGPLVPILNDRLVYDEPYTTVASPHQYRTWLAQVSNRQGFPSLPLTHLLQLECDNHMGRNTAAVDHAMKPFGVSGWGTHGGYLITIDSRAPVDLDRMTKAFEETVNRYGSFRTTLHWDDEKGKLFQTIYPSVDVHNTSIVDLSDEPNAYKVAYDMASANSVDPNFNLNELPLISFVIFVLGGGSYAFNITAHHIAIDETSLGIFLRDLLQLCTYGPGSLPPAQLHYSDFSDWLIRTADRLAELRDKQLEYWSKKLDGVQPLMLTLATPSEVKQSSIGQINDQIDSLTLKRYNDYVATTSATSFSAFFAAYNLLLYKHSTQNSFVVGTTITQHSVAQLQEVVGFFTSVLPVRTTIEDEMTFTEYLEEFRCNLATDLSNDDVAFEDIISHTKTSPQDRSYPKHLFSPGGLDVSVVNRLDTSSITVATAVSLLTGEEKYELLLTAYSESGEVMLRFDTCSYTEGVARHFLDTYCDLIDTLGRDPHVKIGNVSVVSESERPHVAKELPASGPVNPGENKSHQFSEAWVKQTASPDRPLTRCGRLLATAPPCSQVG